jgi:hypothetical protein
MVSSLFLVASTLYEEVTECGAHTAKEHGAEAACLDLPAAFFAFIGWLGCVFVRSTLSTRSSFR